MSNPKLFQESATSAVTITPSDTLPNVYSMIYVGTSGDVKISDMEGHQTIFKNVPAGQYILVVTTIVWSAGTTASNLVGIG